MKGLGAARGAVDKPLVQSGSRRYMDMLRVGALHKFLSATAHFLGRNILDVGRDGPCVSEGIPQGPRSISVELVLDGSQLFCSACDCSSENVVHSLDVHHQTYGGSAQPLPTALAHFRIL